MYRPKIKSNHESHIPFRDSLEEFPFKSLIRFGSVKPYSGYEVEVNPIEGIKNASDKLRSKILMCEEGVKSQKFIQVSEMINCPEQELPPFPLVLKKDFRSKGTSVIRIDSLETYKSIEKLLISLGQQDHWYLEEYFNATSEYRIHASPWVGEIFSVKKIFKPELKDTGEWIKSFDKCIFLESFNRPAKFPEMVEESIKAVKCMGLDFGAVDIMFNNETKDYSIAEVNTAPGLLEKSVAAYKVALNQIINLKFNQ